MPPRAPLPLGGWLAGSPVGVAAALRADGTVCPQPERGSGRGRRKWLGVSRPGSDLCDPGPESGPLGLDVLRRDLDTNPPPRVGGRAWRRPDTNAAGHRKPSRDCRGVTLPEAGQRVFAHLVCGLRPCKGGSAPEQPWPGEEAGLSVAAAARGAGARGGGPALCSVRPRARLRRPWVSPSLSVVGPVLSRTMSRVKEDRAPQLGVPTVLSHGISLARRWLRPSRGDQLPRTLTWHTRAHPHELVHACLFTCAYPRVLTHACSPTHAYPHELTHTCSPTHAHLVGARGGPARFPHPSSLSPHRSPVSGPAAGPSLEGGHWPQ